jgi:uncharacterized protein YggE
VTGSRRPRAGLTPAGHPSVNQGGVSLQADIRSQAKPLHHPRSKALDQDLRLPDCLQRHLHALWLLEIEGDAPPAPLGRILTEELIERRWDGTIHPDDVGPEIGQHHPRPGNWTNPGHFNDADSLQWTHRAILDGSALVVRVIGRKNPFTTGIRSRAMKSGVTVTATGQALVAPDQATINLAASVVRGDAASAMSEVSRRVEALLASLQQAGIADVQTSDLSLWPEADRNGTPIGFRARNGVEISLSDLSTTGDIIAAGLAALGEGAEMSGVSFGRREVDEAESDARANAWQKAIAKAEQLANHAGLSLGRPLSIQETSLPGIPRPMARAAMAEAVPIEGGTTTVTVTLTVRFALIG